MSQVLNTLMGVAAGGLSNAIGYGVDKLTGVGKAQAKDQVEQQGKLSAQQLAFNKEAAEHQQKLNLDMWHATGYGEQRKQLEAAGLNPALMYGGAGAPGQATGGATQGVGGGNASDESSRAAIGLSRAQMGLQMQMQEAMINKTNAEAENIKENTTTTTSTRDVLLANMTEAGRAQFMENAKTRWAMLDEQTKGEKTFEWHYLYGEADIYRESLFNKEVMTAIQKTIAETGNAEASAALNNEKAQIVLAELLNATMIAKAAEQNANTNVYNAATQRADAKAKAIEAQYRIDRPTVQQIVGNMMNDVMKTQEMILNAADKKYGTKIGKAK